MPRAARGRARGARIVAVAATCFDSLTHQHRHMPVGPRSSAAHPAYVARQAVCLTSRILLARGGFARGTVVHCSPRARCPGDRNGDRRRPYRMDRTPMYLPAPDPRYTFATFPARPFVRRKRHCTSGKSCACDLGRRPRARRGAAQTKVLNRDDVKLFERCRRFDAQWVFDMHSRFIGRRRQTDRAVGRLFIAVVPIRR